LFSSIDRPIAKVGESFEVEIECLASPRSLREQTALEATFRSQPWGPLDPRLSLIREKPAVHEETTVRFGGEHGDVPVLRLRRQFIVRALSAGTIRMPAFEMEFAGKTLQTAPHTIVTYRFAGDAKTIQRSVFPIVSETALDAQGSRVHRIGSGFLVAQDAMVTSFHVVVNAARIRIELPGGERVAVKKMWAVDPVRDVAVLHIDPKRVERAGLSPLPIRTPRLDADPWSKDPETQYNVAFTMGWPDGVQQTGSGLLFSSTQEYQYDALWISSNKVRPGDSGGPLLDDEGQVLGVVSYALVSNPTRDAALTDVTVATDLRPALAKRFLADKPRSLRWFRKRSFFEDDPHALAINASTRVGEYSLRRRALGNQGARRLLDEVDLAVSLDPSETTLHYIRGTVYQMLGSFARASESYRETLRREAKHYPAAYSLAYCELAMRAPERADTLFAFSAAFEPYRHLAAYGLAQTKMHLLRYDEAKDLLREILHHHSRFSPAIYMLGRAQAASGDIEATAQLVAKLGHIERRWASMLINSVVHPLYKPVRYGELPRANVPEADSIRIP
jgi:tetratricopeptide (TPR) repeat protein